jgi:hypothetical protein
MPALPCPCYVSLHYFSVFLSLRSPNPETKILQEILRSIDKKQEIGILKSFATWTVHVENVIVEFSLQIWTILLYLTHTKLKTYF